MCGRIDRNSLCNKCNIQLKNQEVFGIDNYIDDYEKYYDEHLYIFMYSGVVRKILIDYKFNDCSFIYKTFTNFILKNEKFVENIKSYDIIIPVPLSKKRKKERGYNQSELIAKEICRLTNLKLNTKSLKKIKNITEQSTLNKEKRETNIKDAYCLKFPSTVVNKKVLIIDDVYTTGSTVNECSKLIKNAGSKQIGILTIAKD
ncbi:MAG: ComF family protein [Clostridia bacterium]|nr:ComF family protein [Clostridia bacterium]